ncbi:MAG: hypothetical protein M3R61_12100 [Chloroflexota bacterium]|nr:hypothetical protein [Chloroflexota bacterium]
MSPTDRPSVPEMLLQLEQAYQCLLARQPANGVDAQRLRTVLAEFQWYSTRLGSQRWEHAPRPKRWSFADNLWHINEQALAATQQPNDEPLRYFIDHGKEHVGQAAEIIAIISYDQDMLL